MADVDFYFCLGCPWSWLAFVRLREAAMRTSARITWKPMLVDRAIRGASPDCSTTQAAIMPPARARYVAKDLQDWARFCGVRIRRAGPFPVRAGQATRGAVVAVEAGKAVPYCDAAFRACFEDGADLDDPAVVAAIAARAGLEPGRFAAAVGDAATLRAVEAWSDELVARGGFGSPTMFVGDDMYFGNDRMPLVELALNQAAERPLVAPGAHGQVR